MKITKVKRFKKLSFFLIKDVNFKVISKRLRLARNFKLKSRLTAIAKANKLLSFSLVSVNSTILRKYSKEKNFERNREISYLMETQGVISKENALLKKKRSFYNNAFSLIKVSPIVFNLKKEICLSKWKYYKQFFFSLKEITGSLKQCNRIILRQHFALFHGVDLLGFSLEQKAYNVFQNTTAQFFIKVKTGLSVDITKAFLNFILFKALQKSIIYTTLLYLVLNMQCSKESSTVKKGINFFIGGVCAEASFWEGKGQPKLLDMQHYNTRERKVAMLKEKKVASMIRRRTSAVLKPNLCFSTSSSTNVTSVLKNYLWKRNNFFVVKGTPTEISKLAQLLNKKLKYSTRRTSVQLLYVLSRLSDKLKEVNQMQDLKAKETAKTNLLLLEGLLSQHLNEKKERSKQTNMLLASSETVFKSQHRTWEKNILKAILIFLNKKYYFNNQKYQKFMRSLHKKLKIKTSRFYNARKITKRLNKNNEKNIINSALKARQKHVLNREVKKVTNNLKVKAWQKSRFAVRRTWAGFKPVSLGKYTTFAQKKQLLSLWAGRNIDLFFINTLSLTKFAFKLERIKSPQNKPNRFLSIIERDFINKYKYVAIYIKDLVRIGFISMFFKKPSFLAKFAAFQLAKLPRNRKETVFIRFLIKAIRTFAAGRKEILAVRVKIKGRVNRWRRTKYIVGTRGTLPLQTISERIEQGTAQAINRKGALGIRIWVRYKPVFLWRFHNHILNYMRYSSLVRVKRRRKAIILK